MATAIDPPDEQHGHPEGIVIPLNVRLLAVGGQLPPVAGRKAVEGTQAAIPLIERDH